MSLPKWLSTFRHFDILSPFLCVVVLENQSQFYKPFFCVLTMSQALAAPGLGD